MRDGPSVGMDDVHDATARVPPAGGRAASSIGDRRGGLSPAPRAWLVAHAGAADNRGIPPQGRRMPRRQDTLIAAVLVLHGLSGLLLQPWDNDGVALHRVLLAAFALSGSIAGLGWRGGRAWAVTLALAYLALQLVYWSGPAGTWSLIVGANLTVGVQQGGSSLGINLLAGLLLGWVGWRALRRRTG
jgi:hypothetical protein